MAMHHVEHAAGQADLRRERRQQGGGGRRELRRLRDHGVARGQGRRDLPGEEVQRQVPRRDGADHAERQPQGVVEPGLAVVRFAGELRGRMREEAQVGDRAGDLDVAGEGVGLAAVQRLGMGEIIEARLDGRGEALEVRGARAVGQCRPGRLRGRGRGDGGIDVGGRALGHFAAGDAARGIVDRQPAAGRGLAGGAADMVEVALHGHRPARAQIEAMRPPSTARLTPLT
jgi:hypothetical protein